MYVSGLPGFGCGGFWVWLGLGLAGAGLSRFSNLAFPGDLIVDFGGFADNLRLLTTCGVGIIPFCGFGFGLVVEFGW